MTHISSSFHALTTKIGGQRENCITRKGLFSHCISDLYFWCIQCVAPAAASYANIRGGLPFATPGKVGEGALPALAAPRQSNSPDVVSRAQTREILLHANKINFQARFLYNIFDHPRPHSHCQTTPRRRHRSLSSPLCPAECFWMRVPSHFDYVANEPVFSSVIWAILLKGN